MGSDPWNYEMAQSYAGRIENVPTRLLAQLLVSEFMMLWMKGKVAPMNGALDLLCIAKMIERVDGLPILMQMCLDGKEWDEGWKGIIDDAFLEDLNSKESEDESA